MLERVAHYQIQETLGQGALGRVYLAQDTKLNRTVALKVLVAGAEDASLRERFHLEARAIAALEHPNIVRILDYADAEAETQFITLEALTGPSLFDLTMEHGPVCEQTALCIGREIASALEHAHAQKIVHRDVKTDNVILEGDRVVLIDFGAMRVVAEHDTVPSPDEYDRIQTVGTPGFMPPEQFARGKVDHRVDLYALGALLYNITTGKLPYERGPDADKMYQDARAGRYVDPREYQPLLTPGFCDLLADCLATRPGERISSTEEVRKRLEKLLHAHGIEDVGAVIRAYAKSPSLDGQYELRSVDALMRELKLALLRDFQTSVRQQDEQRIKDATNRMRYVQKLFGDAEKYFRLEPRDKPRLLRGRLQRRGRWFLLGWIVGAVAAAAVALSLPEWVPILRDRIVELFLR